MKSQKLILDQIDSKIKSIVVVKKVTIPSTGWVHAIRLSLGMSLKQLGRRMNITAQSVKEIVMRTSVNMSLEEQKNSERRIRKAIKEKALEIQRGMPKYLWD